MVTFCVSMSVQKVLFTVIVDVKRGKGSMFLVCSADLLMSVWYCIFYIEGYDIILINKFSE